MSSLYLASLNSGSNGNCYYIGNDEEAVLIDAGISCRETEKRMQRLGLNMTRVKAIFVSHEHSDHIRGLEVLSRKHQLPVYISPITLRHSRLQLDPALTQALSADTTVSVGRLQVHCFQKHHDAADPHSFTVENSQACIGIFTDIGTVCDRLSAQFSRCHAAFLESNYDEIMLEKGRYPYHLKNRIRGGRGHLSNKQALDLFLQYRPQHMSHLLLSHLSADNNHPDLVYELFRPHAIDTHIEVASRYHESPVFEVSGSKVMRGFQPARFEQLKLF
ncbi:MBL fold metallo-hydrolase [Niabella terrae]